jgi:hypothetical protein
MKKKEIKKIARAIYDIRIEIDHDMYFYICGHELSKDGIATSDRCDKNNIIEWMNGDATKKSSDEIHKEMYYLSEKIPDLLISIHAEGEDSEDRWKAYYMNGKYQTCYAKITFDDYDVDKLELLE